MADSSGALSAAFVSILEELNALTPEELIPLSFDVPHAISVIARASPDFESYREPLTALPGFKIERFNMIPTYASASTHIQANYRKTTKRNPEETARLKLGIKLRAQYRADAAGHICRGHIAKARIADVHKGTSFGSVGFGLVGMSTIFREAWPVIGGKVPFSLADLDASDVLAQELIAIDSRVGVYTRSESALMRRRCLTLLVRAYSEAERGLTYLLWEQPKLRAELLPSFRARTGGGKGVLPKAKAPQPKPVIDKERAAAE